MSVCDSVNHNTNWMIFSIYSVLRVTSVEVSFLLIACFMLLMLLTLLIYAQETKTTCTEQHVKTVTELLAKARSAHDFIKKAVGKLSANTHVH